MVVRWPGARLSTMTKVARDVMQPEAVTVPADMPFLSLLHLFVQAAISSAPVVDGEGRVVGLVSMQDLMRAVDQACDEDVDAGEPASRRELGAMLRSLTAGELASSDMLWAEEDTPIARIAAEMRRSGAHRVLVGRRPQLAGVLTTFDLLGVIAAS